MAAHWEKNLPKVPVPDLKETLDKYLSHLKVVIPSGQYEQTRKEVDSFLDKNGLGPKLQKMLQEHAEKSENWINDFWLNDMYLGNPLPLPVNSSPFCLFPKQNFRSTSDVLRFSARVVKFSLQFKEQIDKESLSQDYGTGLAKGRPLCMKTYKNFFTAVRIPGEEKDDLVLKEDKEENHIIVASRNQFFKVKLGKGYQVNEDELVDKLRLIWYLSREVEMSAPMIGLLTTENRKTWATLRENLKKKPKNVESLEALESCLFILCLDDSVFGKNCGSVHGRRDSVEMVRMETSFMAQQLMHGGGVDYYSANRYYDKFLQIVVSRDGICGIIFEHSASEGITLVRFADGLLEYLEKNPVNEINDLNRKESVKGASFPRSKSNSSLISRNIIRLTWDLEPNMNQIIKDASKRLNKLIHDVDLFDLNFTNFGKKFIVEQKMSPDAFVQLSLQLTYYKVHRKMVSTYESASLRQYHLGRVDNIRANTIETLAWVKALCDEIPNITDQQKMNLFQLALKKQVDIAKYTVEGYGPDNHLTALKGIAKLKGLESSLFKEKSYKEHLNFKLSTSQLVYNKLLLIGYGAVVPEGYGCSYRFTDNSITFCITSFFSSPETGSNYFASSLEGSLLQMRELCHKMKLQEIKIQSQGNPVNGFKVNPVDGNSQSKPVSIDQQLTNQSVEKTSDDKPSNGNGEMKKSEENVQSKDNCSNNDQQPVEPMTIKTDDNNNCQNNKENVNLLKNDVNNETKTKNETGNEVDSKESDKKDEKGSENIAKN